MALIATKTPIAEMAAITSLQHILGDRLSNNASVREHHTAAEGMRDRQAPDLVGYPESTEEVSRILQVCTATRTPVIPFGAGTSLEGQLVATSGGLSLDMSRMNAILEVSAEDLDCRVQAGVTRVQLNNQLRDMGLFFPLDPGADATLGGMAATRASGTNAVRYGTMREVTLGLTVVTPDGSVIHTGGRARKSSAGYDLTRLYIGSEGTLGVITEVQLRLFGVPECTFAATCQFRDLKSAVDAVILALQTGLPVARIELLDELQMRASIAYSKLDGFEALPTLFLEFHGGPQAVKEQVDQMAEIAVSLGGSAFTSAEQQEDRNRLWQARHNAYYAGLALEPGNDAFATDACVPISNLATAILESRSLASTSGLTCPIVGHVGDGNFHLLVLYDPLDLGQRKRADKLTADIAALALRLGGTCSGEHGIGLHKLDALKAEHGDNIPVMRAIKAALDPLNIMNPGKTVPAAF